jgi:hypothetical protein
VTSDKIDMISWATWNQNLKAETLKAETEDSLTLQEAAGESGLEPKAEILKAEI